MTTEIFWAGRGQDLKYFVVKEKVMENFRTDQGSFNKVVCRESNKAAEETERGTMGWCLN